MYIIEQKSKKHIQKCLFCNKKYLLHSYYIYSSIVTDSWANSVDPDQMLQNASSE